MPQILPFIPSEPHYEFSTVLDGATYTFEVRWNASDNGGAGAWYFDILNADGSRAVTGVKVVLGVHLARRAEHPLTRKGVLVAIDTSGQAREAGFDDIGTRVQVWHYTMFEVISELHRQAGA